MAWLTPRPGRFTPGEESRYRRQSRSGQVRKISPPIGIRSPDRPARCQSLPEIRTKIKILPTTSTDDFKYKLHRNSFSSLNRNLTAGYRHFLDTARNVSRTEDPPLLLLPDPLQALGRTNSQQLIGRTAIHKPVLHHG